MARVELRGISHEYTPGELAVRDVDLAWETGGSYALLGPSGCGKTTLLKIISGLLVPTRGAVLFDGTDVTRLSPRERNIAQVFQFPVVYDSMTVAENLAFPLENRGLAGGDVAARVREIADVLDLGPDLGKRADSLTADAKQKISLGRGLVRRDVAAILLDEPLTTIDPHVRWLLRRKLRQVQEQLAVTLVYVTHDQGEALTLADRVVVMNEGRVVQQGTPQELFEDPLDPFVGRFIGSPGMNLLDCTFDGAHAVLEGTRVAVDPARVAPGVAGRARLGIRPEHVRFAEHGVPVTILRVEDEGRHAIVTARAGSQPLKIKVDADAAIPGDRAAAISIPARWARVYPPA